jgi:signal transduction histidine kinase
MLRVIAENLVSNAIRYAGPGSVATVTVSDEGNGPLLVVADDGAGVRQTDLPRLFERFYRTDRARSSRGTGLGLAIVKHIVTSAGGTVDAHSAPGRGLEIVCRFPSA